MKEPPKPNVRNVIVKPTSKPVLNTQNTVILEHVSMHPRMRGAIERDTPVVRQRTVLEISNVTVKIDSQITPNVPKVVKQNTSIPAVVTDTELPPSDTLSALSSAGPIPSAPTAGPSIIVRGVSGNPVQVTHRFERLPVLTMTEHVGYDRNVIDRFGIVMGGHEVKPLPKGKPGGEVVGKGRDIQGVLRFARIRHNLSDWWADASSLNALTKWLNEKTKIRADMNVDGGAIRFTDPYLMHTPIVFMTGHDPALVRSRNLLGRQYGGGKMDSRLSPANQPSAANIDATE